MTTPTFEQVKALLITLADAQDPNIREGIYGRHNTMGGYSWETQAKLLASTVIRSGTTQRLIDDLDYSPMSDAEITAKCGLIRMVSAKTNPPGAPSMPPPKPGTNRRFATPDEVKFLIAWVKSLPFPRDPVA